MSKTQPVTQRRKASQAVSMTSNALEIIEERFTRRDAGMRALVEQATFNALIAKLIYDARAASGLTQKQLADLVGTKQPVIARLEDADYAGHSLSMLHRIASPTRSTGGWISSWCPSGRIESQLENQATAPSLPPRLQPVHGLVVKVIRSFLQDVGQIDC